MTYKNITVGDLKDNNSEVLKKLFNIKPKKTTMQDILNETETKIIYNLK